MEGVAQWLKLVIFSSLGCRATATRFGHHEGLWQISAATAIRDFPAR